MKGISAKRAVAAPANKVSAGGRRARWLGRAGAGCAFLVIGLWITYSLPGKHARGNLLAGGAPLWAAVIGNVGVQFRRQPRGVKKSANSIGTPVAILGGAREAKDLYKALSNQDGWVRVAGVFADGLKGSIETRGDDSPVVDDACWAQSFAECCGVDCGIVAVPTKCDAATSRLVDESGRVFTRLYIAPQIDPRGVTVKTVAGGGKRDFLISAGSVPARREGKALKRLTDMAGALTIGLLGLPFLVLVCLAIGLSSRGPVLYKHMRIGKGNRMFVALKFRTMYLNAGERLASYLESEPSLREEWESVYKLKNDPRVTPVGRWLRRFSLDELPQIWNVLVGEMSLVGPRPIVVHEVEKYGPDYAFYEAVRPGLTGLWQVSGRNDTTYDERVAYDATYVRDWSFALDAKILMRTCRAVVTGTGAY